MGKFHLLMGLMDLGGTAYYVLAVAAMLNTAISAYYYLVIAKYMYFDRAEDAAPVASPMLGRAIVLGMVVLTFYLCFRADVILGTTLELRMHV
jgi:NADH:ubiquinone oxidoreductase subunit 2 (subunit N)